jgi:uncharacterized DUF497 family protein
MTRLVACYVPISLANPGRRAGFFKHLHMHLREFGNYCQAGHIVYMDSAATAKYHADLAKFVQARCRGRASHPRSAAGYSARSARTRYTGHVEFEWDPNKAAENLRKHGVTFTEAGTVLGDFLGITVPDPDHSSDELRYITVGLSNRRRLSMVAHAEREQRVRIISARKLTRDERRVYEEAQR